MLAWPPSPCETHSDTRWRIRFINKLKPYQRRKLNSKDKLRNRALVHSLYGFTALEKKTRGPSHQGQCSVPVALDSGAWARRQPAAPRWPCGGHTLAPPLGSGRTGRRA
eukprot:scaffold123530_cov69-Phaeocystis_antarctica.AAC.1